MKKIYTCFFLSSAIFQTTFSQESRVLGTVPGTKSSAVSSPMNGNASLGQSVYDSACGLNYVFDSAHIETRYFNATGVFPGCGGSCTWNISGLPNGYVLDKAYVWANVSYVDSTPPSGSVTITNPAASTSTYSPATGAPIGTDGPKCWGETGSATYRYDVTASISGNGTYAFSFPGFTGTPSGNFINSYDQIDGATLFIIYRDINATYQGTISIWDGALTDGQSGAYKSQTMTGLNVCATPSLARAFAISSDHQPNIGPTHQTTLNGTVGIFPNSMYNFDDTSVSLTSGQTTSLFAQDGGGSDCWLWGVMGLYYQTNCANCCTSLSVVASSTGANCSSGTGTATANAGCGTIPYTYLWSNAQTSQTATGLTAGNYSVTVTDSTGATATATVTVNNTTFNASFSVVTVNCFGGNTGSAAVTLSGGTTPYTYQWSNGATTSATTGLTTGMYSVIVTDATGCVDTFSVAVPGAPQLNLNLSSTPSSCSTCPDGGAFSNVFGGNPPYTYQWNIGATTASITGLLPGSYQLCVTDANGCTQCSIVSLSANGINEFTSNISVSLFPNPFSTSCVFQINEMVANNYELKLFNVLGKETGKYIIHNSSSITISRNHLASGIYFYRLKSEDGTKYANGKLIVE